MRHGNPGGRTQGGMTLVELLVAIAINLVLVTAAAYLYLSTQNVARGLETQTRQQETGLMVMDFIGRDLKNAGFYPATHATTTTLANVIPTYVNIVDATKPAYDQGIYGCDGAVFDPLTTKACPATSASEPDSLVINYFTADNFSGPIGLSQDCLRQNVSNATVNAARKPATSTGPVVQPMLVSNVYSLSRTQTFALESQSVVSRSFQCNGNGNTLFVAQPIFAGVQELRFRYGVYDAASGEVPVRFYTATEVGALPSLTIGDQTRTGWQRVVSVQVCLVTRTLDNAVRQTDKSGSVRTYTDCNGNQVTPADRSIYRSLVRVFALRNNLTATF
jgi:type IV pilus assembly protein PilW